MPTIAAPDFLPALPEIALACTAMALLLIGVVSLDRPGHTFSAVGDFWPFWLMFVALVAVTTSLVKWLRLFRMPQGGDTLDPETASVPELLVWLGLRV